VESAVLDLVERPLRCHPFVGVAQPFGSDILARQVFDFGNGKIDALPGQCGAGAGNAAFRCG
jgi:hypothetical protein